MIYLRISEQTLSIWLCTPQQHGDQPLPTKYPHLCRVCQNRAPSRAVLLPGAGRAVGVFTLFANPPPSMGPRPLGSDRATRDRAVGLKMSVGRAEHARGTNLGLMWPGGGDYLPAARLLALRPPWQCRLLLPSPCGLPRRTPALSSAVLIRPSPAPGRLPARQPLPPRTTMPVHTHTPLPPSFFLPSDSSGGDPGLCAETVHRVDRHPCLSELIPRGAGPGCLACPLNGSVNSAVEVAAWHVCLGALVTCAARYGRLTCVLSGWFNKQCRSLWLSDMIARLG